MAIFKVIKDGVEEITTQDSSAYTYTPEEKYNRLREINPAIDELRRKLDLDL